MIATTNTPTTTRDNNPDRLATKKEAAQILRISLRTLDYLRTSGKITYLKIGGQVRFRSSDIREYMEINTIKRTPTCQAS